VARSKKIEWPDEASNVMRGVAGNLIWEAQRLQEYMDNLSSCATCSSVFDLRDKRHAIVDGHHFCPACNIESLWKSKAKR
jgi:hypothetical protein